jgi:hypothetical protein
MRRSSVLWLALLAAPLVRPAPNQIAFVQVGIHQTEDGELVPQGATHVPGETLFFSFQLEGYRVSPEDKVRIAYEVDAFDPDGIRLLETHKGQIEAGVLPEDKDWKPKVRRTIVIPPFAGSGRYRIVSSVKDEIGGTAATREVFFEVQGHPVKPSETLAIRNLRFARSEDDRKPLKVAAYRAGDALWARFDITGYKFGPGNRIEVEYGVAIEAPSGKTVFSQPQAAVEEGGSFYPKRYVPGAMNLTVQPGTPAGEYTLVISARDRIGNQTGEVKGAFRIE